MATFFQKVTDHYTKNIVNGYLKQQQYSLPYQENSYFIIPSVVIQIILSFYYNPEYFTDHGYFINLNETKKEATYTMDDHDDDDSDSDDDDYSYKLGFNTLYGNIAISKHNYCNRFIWKYNISNPGQDLIIGIGLDASNKSYANRAFDDRNENESVFYAFETDTDGDTYKQCKIPDEKNGEELKYYVSSYGSGFAFTGEEHTLTMELNTKTMVLRYWVDDKDQGIAFDKELVSLDNDIEFVAAISMNEEVTVKLVEYKQTRE